MWKLFLIVTKNVSDTACCPFVFHSNDYVYIKRNNLIKNLKFLIEFEISGFLF
jgi:hypothetical protein